MIGSDPQLHARLQATGRDLVRGLVGAANDAEKVPMFGVSIGALAGIFFAGDEVRNYEDALASDGDAYAGFFNGMLERGVYLPPSRFEALFISTAHTQEHVDRTIEAARDVFSTW
jgi:glutamate-1-semialdehyde 2,1-aminomutase